MLTHAAIDQLAHLAGERAIILDHLRQIRRDVEARRRDPAEVFIECLDIVERFAERTERALTLLFDECGL